jgi:hypothetical protein
MKMARQLRSICVRWRIGWCFLAGALVAAPWLPGVRAGDVEGSAEDTHDFGVQHADCSFFGPQRERLLRATLSADLERMTARAQLTTAVAAALSLASPPLRSRSGAMKRNGAPGPAGGDSIDDFIFGTLEKNNIAAAPLTTDQEFLRRVSLDLTGRIPSPEEVIGFVSDGSANKRAKTVERLLATPQWADRWAMFFGDLYRNTQVTAQVNRYPGGRDGFHLYLLESLQQNKPYDRMAREMLSAYGPNDGRPWPADPGRGQPSPFASFEQYQQFLDNNPPRPTASSYIVGMRTTGGPIQDTYDTAAFFAARDFLGVTQMDCILCHDGSGHLDSLSVWGGKAKRSEAGGLASFFSRARLAAPGYTVPPRTGSTNRIRPAYWYVSDLAEGAYRLNTDSGNRPSRSPEANGGSVTVTPSYPFGGGAPLGGENYRAALGRLLTADVQFSRAIVNYIWKEFFGRAFVEPPDQFDVARLDPSNPPPAPWEIQPSHPELLDFLARKFAENGYNLKWLMAAIANSEAYQLSSHYDGVWNPEYDRYFARHQARRLSAEQLHDALVLSSGIFSSYPVIQGRPPVVFAMQFPDVQRVPVGGRGADGQARARAAAMLDAFLRGDREETPRSSAISIMQALHLMNNPLIAERVQASNQRGVLAKVLEQPNDAAVTAMYLLVLSRFPAPGELAAGVQLLAGNDRSMTSLCAQLHPS